MPPHSRVSLSIRITHLVCTAHRKILKANQDIDLTVQELFEVDCVGGTLALMCSPCFVFS